MSPPSEPSSQARTGREPPLVSVIIPAYNAAAFINRAVESVLAQSWPNRELLVVDDGSTDDTLKVLASHAEQIHLIRKPNGGHCSARNLGARKARGEFLAFLDADDYWKPDKLATQVELMQRHPETGFCSTEAQVVDEEGNEIGRWRCPHIEGDLLHTLFLNNGAVPGSNSGVMVRRSLFFEVGGFDEQLTGLEDTDLWMRLAAITHYRCVPHPLTVIVKRDQSVSRLLDTMLVDAKTVLRNNRRLLRPSDRKGFWKMAYAGILTDYAKWAYRSGQKGKALGLLSQALFTAPFSQGRLVAGILWAMLRGEGL